MFLIAIGASILSALAFITSITQAAKGNYDRSYKCELSGIGWLIVVLICFK